MSAADTYVFIGPTISEPEAREILDATYLPPVEQADVYRIALRRPKVIGIIDGYFERVPAVWHKEILFALTEGIAVFGASSMGALRAAELAPFGMMGVGGIYEAFVSGELHDDDEVAVAHGPAEDGYRAISEAMVNVRATLGSAVAQGVITDANAAKMVDLTKRRFYPERSWAQVVADARAAGLDDDLLAGFRAWLARGRVDQKRLDAERLLVEIARWHGAGAPRPPARYRLEHTIFWDHLVRHTGAGSDQGASVAVDAVLDELRLEGRPYTDAIQAALIRHLGLAEVKRRSVVASPDRAQEAFDDLRVRLGLYETGELESWLADNELTLEQLGRLARDEALLEHLYALAGSAIFGQVADHLRVTGRFGELTDRARRKRDALADRNLDRPAVADTGLTPVKLCAWHAERCGQPAPSSDEEIAGYVTAAGWNAEDECLRALAREYLFRELERDADATG